jgi:transcriptional regulator with XRE-family HTH domain
MADWVEVGKAIQSARGAIGRTEAARLSGVSPSWFLEIEKGIRPPRPGKLAQALIRLGADIRPIFKLAGYDPTPYLDQQQRWRAARDAGFEIADTPADDDVEITELLGTVVEELRGLREDVQRMDAAVEQLVAQPSTRSDGSSTAPRPAST